MSSTETFDAVVVGAGPAGSTAAMVMARKGLHVALVERGEYPGAKSVTGGALYGTTTLERLWPGFCTEAPVERYITRRVLGMVSVDGLTALDFKSGELAAPPYNGYTVLRPKLDRWLADQAVKAGAVLISGTVVDGLLRRDGQVEGVRTRRPDGDLRAKVVVAADGVMSFLAREAGLQRHFQPEELSLGVKEVIGFDRAAIEDRFQLNGGEGVAYELVGDVTKDINGGAFLYTNAHSISIGVITQLSSLTRNRLNPYDLLTRFKDHPSIRPLVRGGTTKEYSAHLIPEGGWHMIPKLVGPGLLVAGDAAALVLVTGYYLQGMNYAILSGEAAADTVVRAVENNDVSEAGLAGYRSLLEERHVLGDFQKFRRAPAFLNNDRLQNVYPSMACSLVGRVLAGGEGPKEKLVKMALAETKDTDVSWLQMYRDVRQAGKALLW